MTFSKALLQWFDVHGRHNLPWQTGQAYHVWLSEIMLQQTQVATVIPYFEKFLRNYQSVSDLAAADLDHVLSHWAGLGYYARARNLHKTAKIVSEQYAGEFPATVAELQALPGIGRSTAGAIVAQAFDQRALILDGNVKRVLSRMFEVAGWYGEKKTENQLWELADSVTPKTRVADYTQAIMDLGATVCIRGKPRCGQCPMQHQCQAFAHGTTEKYPEKKPKKAKPTRHSQWLILSTQDGQIFLQQSQEKLWGGLWLFPNCEIGEDAGEILRTKYTGSWHAKESLAPFTHTFTHFHLNIQPIHFLIEKKSLRTGQYPSRWIKLTQIDQLAVPAPVKRVLQSLA